MDFEHDLVVQPRDRPVIYASIKQPVVDIAIGQKRGQWTANGNNRIGLPSAYITYMLL